MDREGTLELLENVQRLSSVGKEIAMAFIKGMVTMNSLNKEAKDNAEAEEDHGTEAAG